MVEMNFGSSVITVMATCFLKISGHVGHEELLEKPLEYLRAFQRSQDDVHCKIVKPRAVKFNVEPMLKSSLNT